MLEKLKNRLLLAIPGMLVLLALRCSGLTIQFDYTYDTSSFFSGANVARRTYLDLVGDVFESRITDTFGSIAPSGGNTWSWSINNPATGTWVTTNNPTAAADTVVIYIGARDLAGGALGYGGGVGYSYSGDSSWGSLIASRNTTTSYEPFAGAIAFDNAVSWYFDSDPNTVESFTGQYDFFSVAVHELAHVLGFGTSKAFTQDVTGLTFLGPIATNLYGGPVPLDSGKGHFAEGTQYNGQEVAMDPNIGMNQRKNFTELDYAILADIGYTITTNTGHYAPLIRAVPNITLREDTSTNIVLSVWDIDSDPTNIVIQATATNALATFTVITNQFTNAVVTITPSANLIGVTRVTLRVMDESTNANSIFFTLTVNGVNDAPGFNLRTNLFVVGENAGAQSFANVATNMSVGPANEAQTYSFTVTAANTAAFSTQPAIGTNGTLTFTVKTNTTGFYPVRVAMKDNGGVQYGGRDTSATNFFYVSVTNVAQGPVIAGATNRTILEDTAVSFPVTITDADRVNVRLTASSSTNGLVAVTLAGTGAARTLTLTPGANANGGPATIKLVADDGVLKSTNTFLVTVTAVNDRPAFNIATNLLVLGEDAAAQTNASFVSGFSMGPADEASQTAAFSIGSTATNFFSLYPYVETNNALIFKVATNAYGTNILTIRMTDDGGTNNKGVNWSTNLVRVVVTNVNDAPTLGTIANKTILEDAGTTNLAFTVNDIDTLIGSVTLTVSSSDSNVVRAAVSGATANRIAAVTAVANGTGTATITLVASDGALTATNTFDVTVTATNDAPRIAALAPRTILEDAGTTNITLTVSDVDTALAGVTVTAASGNTNLVAATNLTVSGTGASRTLAITPGTNAFGTNLITLVADDGINTTTNIFTLIVQGVNDAPSFGLSTNTVTVGEDAGAVTVAGFATSMAAGPANEAAQALTFALTTASNAFFTTQPAINSTNGTLSFKTATNVYGTVTVKVWLNDNGGTSGGGVSRSATNTFSLVVTNVDDATTLTLRPNLAIVEDRATNVAFAFRDLDSASVTFTTSSSDSNLVVSTVGGSGTNRYLTLLSATNANGGPATITLIADDGDGLKVTNTMSVTVLPVNDAPSFDFGGASGVGIMEDDGLIIETNLVKNISTGPANESSQTFSFTVSASVPTNFFAVQPTMDTNGTLTFKTATNVVGNVYFTIRMTDSGGTTNGGVNWVTNSIGYAVNAVNDAPLLSTIANRTLAEDFKPTNILFTVTDVDTAQSNVTVTISSSASNLLTGAISGTTSNRTVTLTSVTNAYGTATLTLIASDGALSATNTFDVTVTNVNDAPVLGALSNLTTNEDAGVVLVSLAVSDVDTTVTNVTVTPSIANTNLASVTVTNVDYANRVLVITTKTNATGSALVSLVTADDGGKSSTNRFLLALNPINDAPSFTLSTNLLVLGEDAGATTVSNFLTGISAGPTNEAAQKVTFYVTASSNAFFKTQPAISPVGTLTFATALNATGTVAVAVYAKDGGGTNNGGVDLSATNTFSVTVTNVNDGPTVGAIASLTVLEDCGPTNRILLVSDLDTAFTNLTVSASCSKTNLAAVTATNDGTSLYVTVTPRTNTNSLVVLGSAAVSVVVSDGTASVTNNFLLTVTPVNDAPTFTLGTNAVYAQKYLVDQVVSNLVQNVVVGPTSDETNQTWKANVTVDTASLFATAPTIDPKGTLKYKPGTNSGTATVTVTLTDSGGKLNGGKDTADAQTFSIVIPANPFTTLAGDYNGLFYETNGTNHDRSGFVGLNVNGVGAVSGYLLTVGLSNRFAGQLDLQAGQAQITVSNTALKLDLALDLTNGTETVSGTVTNTSGSWQAALQAVRSIYGTETPAVAVGTYTMAFPGSTNAATAPGGDGIGWVTVDTAGMITMSGLLADGSTVSQRVGISKYAEWPLYVGTHQKGTNGSLLSWVTFTDTNATSAILSNNAVWIKKSAAGGMNYSGGFTNLAAPLASVYNAWDGLWSTNAVVVLGGGNLAAPITNNVTVWYDTVTVDPAATNQLTLAIDPASGYVSGSFKDPSGLRTNQIRGVVLQMTGEARGYFLGTDQSGYFLLK